VRAVAQRGQLGDAEKVKEIRALGHGRPGHDRERGPDDARGRTRNCGRPSPELRSHLLRVARATPSNEAALEVGLGIPGVELLGSASRSVRAHSTRKAGAVLAPAHNVFSNYRVSRCSVCFRSRLQYLVNSSRSASLRRFFSVV
jgi:hypothetical protein